MHRDTGKREVLNMMKVEMQIEDNEGRIVPQIKTN